MPVSRSSKHPLDITAITQEHWDALQALRRETFSHIEQLIEEVRRCRLPEQYRLAQQHLAAHIERVSSSLGNANRSLEHVERGMRRLGKRNASVDSPEMVKARREIEAARVDHRFYRTLLHHYRLVGDAMAWQLYDFQALSIYDWREGENS